MNAVVRCRTACVLAAMVMATLLAGCADGDGDEGDAEVVSLPATPPSILLISIDTLRSDHLAAYGYERETAPTLSRLAQQGVVFENGYAPASSTVPSHATMFTGRLPFQHGCLNFKFKLPDEEFTLAELLGKNGYATFAAASSVRFIPQQGFDQGFDNYENFANPLPKNERARQVTDEVLARMAEHTAGAQRFFGFVHYLGPHEPYAPPEPFRSRWHPGLTSPVPPTTGRYVQFHNRPGQHVPPETLEYLTALYDAEILYLDSQLARLFEAVGQLPEPVLLIVTSDHGEEFKEHGGLSHSRHLHEELVRVPLIVHWPGVVPAGRRVTRPGHLADLLPTVAELLGTGSPQPLAGRSLLDDLLGRGNEEPGAAVVIGQQQGRWSLTATLGAGRFKYMVNEHESVPGFYRLDADAFGTVPVDQRYPSERSALLDLAERLGVDSQESMARVRSAAADDADVQDMLREMGYVDETRGGG